MKNIILFGGSFDPIHHGHLNMAEIAKEKLNAEKVIFIPNGVSVWKEKETLPEDKYQMIKIALRSKEGFSVSRFELNKADNYTIQTVRHFKKVYPTDNLFFLIGADQVNEFHRWKEADEIASLTKIVYFKRTNFEIKEDNIKRFKMLAVEGKEIDVSSTEVRNLLRPDSPLRVLKYIQDHNLYYMKQIAKYINGQRLEHSKSVALLAYQIALDNKIEHAYKAYVGGILHDLGKNLDKEIKSNIEKQYAKYLPMSEKLYHQFYSARLAREVFHIEDQMILEAIEFHATGSGEMNPISKIVYASDKIDPSRGYDSRKMIRSMKNDYKEGFIYVLRENKKHLLKKMKDVDNKLTSECFKNYL